MAHKFRANCKICMFIKGESPEDVTKSDLYGLFVEHQLGKRSLTDVNRAYPELAYPAIRNHSKKHQHITETRLAKSKAHKAKMDNAIRKRYSDRHHSENRGDVIEWVMSQIDEGNVKPTAGAIVQLLKQQTDIEEKQKDRVHEMQKLFSAYIANPLPEVATRHIEYVEGEVVEDTKA